MGKKFFMLCFCLLLVNLVVACGANPSTKTKVQTRTSSLQETPTLMPEITPTPTSATPISHKIGEVVNVDQTWEITVNNLKTYRYADYSKPSEGNFYLLVNVTVKNISNKQQLISSMANFSMKVKATGLTLNYTFIISAGHAPAAPAPNGNVEPGGVLTGDLTYQTPANEKEYLLSFQINPYNSQGTRTLWDLKRSDPLD